MSLRSCIEAGEFVVTAEVGLLKGTCQGVHIMAMGWESKIPAMLDAAGL